MNVDVDIKNLKFLPLKEWESVFGFPKIGTLKYLCLKREKNGFSSCITIINGRIYLKVQETLNYFSGDPQNNG